MVSLSTQQAMCPNLSITSQQSLEQMFWIFSEVFELNGEHQHLAALNGLWTLCLIWLVNTRVARSRPSPRHTAFVIKKNTWWTEWLYFVSFLTSITIIPTQSNSLVFSLFYWKAPACVFLPCYRVTSIQSPNKNTRLTHQIKHIKMEADFSLASRFISLGWNTSKQKPSFELQQQNKAVL